MFCRKMNSVNKVIVILLIMVKFSAIAKGQAVTRLDSKFRILAPEFICPKDENAVVEKPDNTIITLQTVDANLHIEWTVRWTLLTPTPAQRFTLMLWSTVRRLERLLNKPQPEPYVYVIENSELLHGVNYTFNIVSLEPNGEVSESKSFHIDNTQGEQQLMIEGRNALLSVLLVGAQVAYVDSVYIVDALITTCKPTHDYYFIWTVQSVSSEINDSIDLSHINGSRVEVPECTLKTGFIYTINCQVMRYNSGDLITKTSMPFVVQQKGIEVYLSVDYMVISTAQPFTMDSLVVNHDDCHRPVTLEWDCLHKADPCTAEMVLENGTLTFPSGLKDSGDYLILLTATVGNQSNIANATIKVVQPPLPVIELTPVERKLNKGQTIELVANATNLTPACNLTWYFASEGYLASLSSATSNGTCDNCQHGVPLSETVKIISLEEQFLSELSDFSNETEWRQVVAPFAAEGGRARFLVECECSLINCYTRGTVYADLWLQLNEGPKVKDVLISPETGTALETVFRLSTLAADDPHSPLDYSFYCRADNDTILLASHVEHRAVETLLPYIDSGVEVWVKVCDNLGACSKSASKTMTLTPGHSRTIEELISEVSAHARRCELTQLERVVQSAIITYTNAHQSGVLTKLYDYLQTSLAKMDKENCIIKYYGQYSELLYWLANHGVEIPNILITT